MLSAQELGFSRSRDDPFAEQVRAIAAAPFWRGGARRLAQTVESPPSGCRCVESCNRVASAQVQLAPAKGLRGGTVFQPTCRAGAHRDCWTLFSRSRVAFGLLDAHGEE